MAVLYESVSWAKIEQPLMDILANDFPYVYCSPRYQESGSESVRINLVSSTNLNTTNAFEQREYNLIIRYYMSDCDITNMQQNEATKNKIDRLKKKLLDIIVTQATSKHNASWDELLVNSIEYDIQDEENEDKPDLYIAELDITIQHLYNH